MNDVGDSQSQVERSARVLLWFVEKLTQMALQSAYARSRRDTGEAMELCMSLERLKEDARGGMTDAELDAWIGRQRSEFFGPHYEAMVGALEMAAGQSTRAAIKPWLEAWVDRLQEVNNEAATALSLLVQYADEELDDLWGTQPCPQYPQLDPQQLFGGGADASSFIQFGGEPDWVQEPEHLICKGCDNKMALMMQLSSLPPELAEKLGCGDAYAFGDNGRVWVFGCQTCMKFETVWQCY